MKTLFFYPVFCLLLFSCSRAPRVLFVPGSSPDSQVLSMFQDYFKAPPYKAHGTALVSSNLTRDALTRLLKRGRFSLVVTPLSSGAEFDALRRAVTAQRIILISLGGPLKDAGLSSNPSLYYMLPPVSRSALAVRRAFSFVSQRRPGVVKPESVESPLAVSLKKALPLVETVSVSEEAETEAETETETEAETEAGYFGIALNASSIKLVRSALRRSAPLISLTRSAQLLPISKERPTFLLGPRFTATEQTVSAWQRSFRRGKLLSFNALILPAALEMGLGALARSDSLEQAQKLLSVRGAHTAVGELRFNKGRSSAISSYTLYQVLPTGDLVSCPSSSGCVVPA